MKMKRNMRGLILAGGESSRLGRDKSVLIFHDIPQRDFLFDLLKKFCNDVHLSCKSTINIPEKLSPLPDRYVYNSPLNGIISAFDSYPLESWLTVPVDMPNVDEKVISYLIKNRDINTKATCFYDSENKLPEPLLAIWEPEIRPSLKEFQSSGKRSPRDFLMSQNITLLKSPFQTMHTNINTQTDLDEYNRHHS